MTSVAIFLLLAAIYCESVRVKAMTLIRDEIPKNLRLQLGTLLPPEMSPESEDFCVQLMQRHATLKCVRFVKENITERECGARNTF